MNLWLPEVVRFLSNQKNMFSCDDDHNVFSLSVDKIGAFFDKFVLSIKSILFVQNDETILMSTYNISFYGKLSELTRINFMLSHYTHPIGFSGLSLTALALVMQNAGNLDGAVSQYTNILKVRDLGPVQSMVCLCNARDSHIFPTKMTVFVVYEGCPKMPYNCIISLELKTSISLIHRQNEGNLFLDILLKRHTISLKNQ